MSLSQRSTSSHQIIWFRRGRSWKRRQFWKLLSLIGCHAYYCDHVMYNDCGLKQANKLISNMSILSVWSLNTRVALNSFKLRMSDSTTRRYSTLRVPTSSSCGGLVAFATWRALWALWIPPPWTCNPEQATDIEFTDTMSGHNVLIQCLDTMSGHNVLTQCVDTMCGHNVLTQCQDTMAGHNGACSNAQYSTGEEDGVRGWLTPYSTLCGATVTGAASLVAECGTNILFKKNTENHFFLNPFGALPKISDWIRNYVQIRHDF